MALSVPRPAFRRSLPAAAALCGCFALGPAANAALIDRGNGLIYDTDLDLTWLADANAALGSAYDDGTNTADGRMSWASATAWAASLTTGGVTGWRLPDTPEFDATCTVDPEGTQPAVEVRGYNCTGSDMGHLFYVELSGDPASSILNTGDEDVALFSNLQGEYWSGTTETLYPDYAWYFVMTQGAQNDAFKTTNFMYGWAVHDGDVAVIPAPAASWLLGTGLLGVLGAARRRRAAPRLSFD